MTDFTTSSGNVVTKFDAKLMREYVRGNAFGKFMGKMGTKSPITIKEDSSGKIISIPLTTKLTGAGVTGSATLRGNEEAISNYSDVFTPTYHRNAVSFDKEELDKPAFDIRAEARPMLTDWGMELIRDEIIQACAAVHNAGVYSNFSAASEALKDSWSTANVDRVLYGAARANHSGDVSADLAKVDSTNDTASKAILGIAKRMASTSSAKIRPFKTMDTSYDMYIWFVGTNAYRDIYNSAEVQGDLQNAGARAASNALFSPGDLMFDNVIVREVPEITEQLTNSVDFVTAGNGGIPVEPTFLMGAEAIGYALSRRPTTVAETFDYEFKPGVAVEMKHHIKKMVFNDLQHGMVTVFVSGVADA